MKKLHYSKDVKRKMTGRVRRARRRIDWNAVGSDLAIVFMMFGFLAALIVRFLV